MTDTLSKLPDPLRRFVEERVASGAYADAASVVTAGLESLAREEANDEAKMARLLVRLQSGIDQLDRGEGEIVTDLKTYFDQLEREALGD